MHHNINMFTTGNTHLKYRKHRVHSAAQKLKIRSSRLVLTTAGTNLDSTDRAAIGGAKNSSASEPLKRPILSLWNSREWCHEQHWNVQQKYQTHCQPTFFCSSSVKNEPAGAQIWSRKGIFCTVIDKTSKWSLQMKIFWHFLCFNSNVYLPCAHQCPERSHDTY